MALHRKLIAGNMDVVAVQKQHAMAIFFDLEKAYDTTWKHGIMKDLSDAGLRDDNLFHLLMLLILPLVGE